MSDFEINRRGDHRSPVLQTRNFNRGPRKAKAFGGKRSELCEAQETRGSKFTAPFRRQIWSILSQVRAKNIRVTQENNMTGSHKKQRYYETVHRTVSSKFVARFVRQIWSILSQVRAIYIFT